MNFDFKRLKVPFILFSFAVFALIVQYSVDPPWTSRHETRPEDDIEVKVTSTDSEPVIILASLLSSIFEHQDTRHKDSIMVASADIRPIIITGGLLSSIKEHQDNSFDLTRPPEKRKRSAHAASNAKIFLFELDLAMSEGIIESDFVVENINFHGWNSWKKHTMKTTFSMRPAGWKWMPNEERSFTYLSGTKAHPFSYNDVEGKVIFESGSRKGQSIAVKSISRPICGSGTEKNTIFVLEVPLYESDQDRDGTIRLSFVSWGDYEKEGFIYSLNLMDIRPYIRSVGAVEGTISYKSECPKYFWLGKVDEEIPEIIHLSSIDKTLFRFDEASEIIWDYNPWGDNSPIARGFTVTKNVDDEWIDDGVATGKCSQCQVHYSVENPDPSDIPTLAYWPAEDPYKTN